MRTSPVYGLPGQERLIGSSRARSKHAIQEYPKTQIDGAYSYIDGAAGAGLERNHARRFVYRTIIDIDAKVVPGGLITWLSGTRRSVRGCIRRASGWLHVERDFDSDSIPYTD